MDRSKRLVIGSTRPDFWLNDDGTETPIVWGDEELDRLWADVCDHKPTPKDDDV